MQQKQSSNALDVILDILVLSSFYVLSSLVYYALFFKINFRYYDIGGILDPYFLVASFSIYFIPVILFINILYISAYFFSKWLVSHGSWARYLLIVGTSTVAVIIITFLLFGDILEYSKIVSRSFFLRIPFMTYLYCALLGIVLSFFYFLVVKKYSYNSTFRLVYIISVGLSFNCVILHLSAETSRNGADPIISQKVIITLKNTEILSAKLIKEYDNFVVIIKDSKIESLNRDEIRNISQE